MAFTFVTSLLGKNESDMIDHLRFMIDIPDIHILLYVSNENKDVIPSQVNVHQIEMFPDITGSWVYAMVNEILEDLENPEILPSNRNIEKDTFNFILTGHTKHEIMEHAVHTNPWNSTHFAWFDFDLAKLFRNRREITEYIQWMHKNQWSESFLTFPGCWSKMDKEKINDVLDSIHWRFCGGFFMGDGQSILTFYDAYKRKFPEFLRAHRKLVWDLNFWAWMETFYEEWPSTWTWYRGDHNDSIVMTSGDLYTRTLENIIQKIEYSYPAVDTYYPTSASYLFHDGKHLLNTRYVNYWIYPTGCYLFANGKKLIENKNMFSELDAETLEPIQFQEICEEIDLPMNEDILSQGLEDLRLYEFRGQVKYIATTMGYSPGGKSRMIVGNYDYIHGRIEDGKIIQPPEHNADSWCEKNWIPIVQKQKIILGDGSLIDQEKELFIYKWSPLEIGYIDYELGQLVITDKHEMVMPLFSRIRGSTIFEETDDGWMGVVHYSEEHSPRHYYHMLVLLDKDTFALKRYSYTFCFEKLGVEFCLGFKIYKNELDALSGDSHYIFWISRHDRDPLMLKVPMDEIKWT